MNKIDFPKYKINNYPMYGLNHNRSFMKAPVCDCGCGQPMHTVLETKDEVREFCMSTLNEYDCPESGIFAVFLDGTYMAVWKAYDHEREEMTFLVAEGNDTHFFSEIDGEFRLCCYNLIIEEDPGQWMIQS